jgi:hydroxylamine dehydrogenase
MSAQSRWPQYRVLAVGLTATLIILGLAVVVAGIGRRSDLVVPGEPVDALANSSDACVTCHREESPGIVTQFSYSTMAAAGTTCQDCHEVPESYPGAKPHEGGFVLSSPTTARCETCHESEVTQFYASRHSIPAYVAYAGAAGLSAEHQAMYEAIPEGSYSPSKARNQLYEMEGPEITKFACETCHNIGQPHLDGSVGQCQDCHMRHTFSLEQARKPETCNACHIGPDHPQWEIYQESPHGIAYMTDGDNWNWDAEPGTLTVLDLPAATCATCHISGFGTTGTSHDVGERLSWYLFAPKSTRRPDWEANMTQMQGVCISCHNEILIDEFYADADAATDAVNAWVDESNEILASLAEGGMLTDAPFDQPVDFVHFELWHHWGRTTKFGAWMQGPDYVQWHGAYEVLSDLAELREFERDLTGKTQQPEAAAP